MLGSSLVDRKPPIGKRDITQSVVFEKSHKWTIPKAKSWLKKHGYFHDDVDNKETQIRFRQYNPEDLYDRHYISKKLKNEGVILILSILNEHGSGIMLNNVEQFTPQEILNSHIKHFTKKFHEETKNHEKLEKEKEKILKRVKASTKSRVKHSLKGTQEMKDKMAKLRALKKK